MKILVPLDGSETAETALPIALRLAQHPGDSIVLVSAVSRRHREPPAPAEPDVASVLGFVRSQADIDKAVQVARGVAGVKSVKNDMRLK